MNIELDGMPLIQHVRDPETGATKDLRSVYNIDTSERRRIVEHKIPGLEGGVLQDLGREPVRISFDGIFYGEAAKENLEGLRSKFKMGKPVPFNSDITGAAEVTQVLIEDLSIEDIGGITNRYKYSIALREYLSPREPTEESVLAQEEEAKEQIDELANQAAEEVLTKETIEEAESYIREVESEISNKKEMGYDTTEAEEMLKGASSELEGAMEYYKEGVYAKAVSAAEEAKKLVKGAAEAI